MSPTPDSSMVSMLYVNHQLQNYTLYVMLGCGWMGLWSICYSFKKNKIKYMIFI